MKEPPLKENGKLPASDRDSLSEIRRRLNIEEYSFDFIWKILIFLFFMPFLALLYSGRYAAGILSVVGILVSLALIKQEAARLATYIQQEPIPEKPKRESNIFGTIDEDGNIE
jgi:hypothetical protein